jgi:2,4-dienoyl-CoA reductase-like NADH-dependent reductase (Old Yellow Enzyme family)
MYSLPHGKVFHGQTGFATDAHAETWRPIVNRIHSFGSRVVFQIGDAGARADGAAIGGAPRGPSGFLPGSRAMTIAEIEELVQSFVAAAKRLVRIGVDGINLHCAHGYGLSQFLSPVSNRRTDLYGGSPENRARIVREIATAVRKVTPSDFAITVKINGHDGVPGGVTPELCAQYVQMLARDGVQLFEISTGFGNPMVFSRADLKEGRVPRAQDKEQWSGLLKAIEPEFPFSEGYTKPYAEIVRRANPGVDLAIVGGNRTFAEMEKLVAEGRCEFIAISRPFIRDQKLINRFFKGELDKAECVSCNQCFLKQDKGIVCRFPPF